MTIHPYRFRRALVAALITVAAWAALPAGTTMAGGGVEPFDLGRSPAEKTTAKTTGDSSSVPASHTAGSCSGTHIGHWRVPASGTIYGYFDVYYSSANGGTNCVRLNASGSGFTSDWKYVELRVWDQPFWWYLDYGYTACHNGPECDVGVFYSYAGPVRETNLAGQCIDITGFVEVGSTRYWRTLNNVHCG